MSFLLGYGMPSKSYANQRLLCNGILFLYAPEYAAYIITRHQRHTGSATLRSRVRAGWPGTSVNSASFVLPTFLTYSISQVGLEHVCWASADTPESKYHPVTVLVSRLKAPEDVAVCDLKRLAEILSGNPYQNELWLLYTLEHMESNLKFWLDL